MSLNIDCRLNTRNNIHYISLQSAFSKFYFFLLAVFVWCFFLFVFWSSMLHRGSLRKLYKVTFFSNGIDTSSSSQRHMMKENSFCFSFSFGNTRGWCGQTLLNASPQQIPTFLSLCPTHPSIHSHCLWKRWRW